eukprot:TRINITY_DN5585_c0_g1_i1.p1 TRINITY_DN5585_c0_g1~~TRINITY_DN5585_c0_g1_i1.p1  ORF type:complete len:463 (+),score=112.64 TRINITY_DN5585_c0_g1_i1:40-1389(+)
MAGERPFSIFDRDRIAFRLVLLINICFLTFGSYFVYDIPSALQSSLVDWFDINPFEYNLFYSVYSWPNTVLAFIGGYLVDRVFGVRLGAVIFCGLCAGGMAIFALGVSLKTYWLAVLGRAVFGLGGESLSVTQSTYTAKWFKGKELALAFGICLSFSRVGSSINFNTMPYLTEKLGIRTAIWIGVFMCLISLAVALSLAFLDWRATKYRKDNNLDLEEKEEEKVSLKDVLSFPISYFYLVFICVAFYIAIFVFIQDGGAFLQEKYDLSQAKGDTFLSIPSLISAAISPFLGFAVDKIGFSLFWVLIASIGMIGVHLILALTHWHPIAPMIILGFSYSICAAALWPCVALVIPTHQLGSAYGLMTAMQNLGLAVAPLVVGFSLTKTNNNFTLMEFTFVGFGACSALFSVLVILLDIQAGRQLNCSSKTLKERQEKIKNEEKAALLVNQDD